MCGGKGKRLNMGEKPLVKVCGKKLIDHSIQELREFELIIVTSPYVPKTEGYVKSRNFEVFRACGRGFIQDYIQTCIEYSISEPVLIVSSDIVYFQEGILEDVVSYYFKSNKPSLKVTNDGKPVGINVIDPFFLDYKQEEEIYARNDIININTIEDLLRAEEICMNTKKKEKDLQKD